MRLTDEQHRVVNINNGFNIVIAPAGSGKTELLAERVKKAISLKINPKEMACLTFTIKAGQNMINRVGRIKGARQVTIGNIHSVCADILKRNYGVLRDVQVIDEDDVDELIKEINEKFETNENIYKVKKLATFQSRLEHNIPEKFLDKSIMEIVTSATKAVAKEYIKEKEENNYIDYDDILTLAYNYLSKEENKNRFYSWLEVDEVQDLNALQLEILNLLSKKDATIVYFGDYNQAIYGFMGADTKAFNELKDRAGENIFYLTKNFRSPMYLIDIYNKFLSNELDKYVNIKGLDDNNSLDNNVGLALCNKNNEDRILFKAINSSLKKYPNDTNSILVRANKEVNRIYENTISNNIEVFKMSGMDLFRTGKVKTIMAYLSILCENNYLSWTRLLYGTEVFKTLKDARDFTKKAYLSNIYLKELIINKSNDKYCTDLYRFVKESKHRDIVVFDTETTGLNTATEDIIQIAAVKLKSNGEKEELDVYINTDKDVSKTEPIHHISKSYLDEHGVGHEEGLQKFLDFCGENSLIIAHNLQYDYNILKHNIDRYMNRDIVFPAILGGDKNFFDTLVFSRQVYNQYRSFKLENLIKELNLEGVNSHNALDDTRATAELVKRIITDSEDILKNQEKFVEDNLQTLNKIYNKLKEPLDYYDNRKNSQMKLCDLISWFINNVKTRQYSEADIYKLTNHIEMSLIRDNMTKSSLKSQLDRYYPIYKKFNESDLYYGKEKVLLSTIHKAKGLEFDTVFLPEVDKLCFYKNGDDRKETACLFYVAITRAKKRLYLFGSGFNGVLKGLEGTMKFWDYRDK